MPGPCSAPNGNYFLTVQARDKGTVLKTGKTAKKRGANFDEARKGSIAPKRKLSAARRREQESTE